MAEVFEGKVRRLGNSMAVIIPSHVLSDVGAHEGDILKLTIPIPDSKRRDAWKRFAGIDRNLPAFRREKHDRADDL